MPNRQDIFFEAVSARRIPRIRIVGLVFNDGSTLVQKPKDDPSSFYAFIGGEYEFGDTFETRLRKEFEEETNAKVIDSNYLFSVENHFEHNTHTIQQVEHYFDVKLNRFDVESREDHLTQHWLPVNQIRTFDIRPIVVRDAIADGRYLIEKHLIQIQS